jgi:hypothetical protein
VRLRSKIGARARPTIGMTSPQRARRSTHASGIELAPRPRGSRHETAVHPGHGLAVGLHP